MKFNCKILDQKIIDDLIDVELSGASGFLWKQFGQFLIVSSKHFSEIQSSISKSDYDSAIVSIHKLGGLCGTLGALKASRDCRDIEVKIKIQSNVRLVPELESLARNLDDAKGEVQVFLSDLARSPIIPRKQS